MNFSGLAVYDALQNVASYLYSDEQHGNNGVWDI